MRPRKLVPCLLVASLILVLVPSSVSADSRDSVVVNPIVGDNTAGLEIAGVSAGDKVVGPGVDPGLRNCSWGQSTLLEFSMLRGGPQLRTWEDEDAKRKDLEASGSDPSELWNYSVCILNNGINVNGWPASDPLPPSFFDWLVAYGYALVEIPLQYGMSSPVGDTNAPMITQLETWLWVDPTVWAPVSATTPPVFGVTATVTATPSSVEFVTSEGEYVNCGANTGPAYNYSVPDNSQATACSVTYRNASSVADHSLTSTLRWTVTYDCSSAACPSGTLPDFVIVTSREVRVAEIMGVGTSNGT